MLRLSMNQLTTMRWSFEEDIDEYRSAGLDAIGVWRSKLTDVGVEKGAALIETAGLQCSNLLWAGGFTGSDGCSHRDSIQDAIEAIRSAAVLGADCLVVYSGSWGGHTRKHARRLVQQAIRDLIPFAEEFGVTLAIEPMHPGCAGQWTFLNSISETLDVIDAFETPYLQVVLDTYQFGLDEGCQALLSDIANRIAVVHLGDGYAPPTGEQNRCQLGHGQIPLQSIISTLLAAGYDGYFDIELMGEAVEPFNYKTLIRDAAAAVRELATSAL